MICDENAQTPVHKKQAKLFDICNVVVVVLCMLCFIFQNEFFL